METGRIKLDLDEHFIIKNFKSRLPQYAGMWIAAVLFAYVMGLLPITHPVYDYAGLRAFSLAFLTIAVTTITFAIPTCMRTIFASYEQYYSTKISEILLRRFPVTLLALSAFTSLVVSLLVISGIIGITVPIAPVHAFYVALFWTVVCICYLFIAIEKLIYFVVKAPYAVLDKLEYGVSRFSEIKTREDYDEFRRELASMNDIAATIISRSTGQDEAIIKVLKSFRSIHLQYLLPTEDEKAEKLAMNACRAVDHEIVRIFRVAASAKNEQASRNILRTYCEMMADSMDANCGIWYFTDMLSQIERMQSYADASSVGEIRSLTYANWFFMLAGKVTGKEHDSRKYTAVVRELSSALRKATLAGYDETIVKFMRVASNSELEYDIPSLPTAWQTMLDRAVFVYTTWLIDTNPTYADYYLDYVKKYSSVTSGVFRSVLPDDIDRVRSLITYESVASKVSYNTFSSKPSAKSSSSDKVVLTMSLHNEDNASSVIALLMMFECADMPLKCLKEFGVRGERLFEDIKELQERFDDPEITLRLELVERVVPGLLEKIGETEDAVE